MAFSDAFEITETIEYGTTYARSGAAGAFPDGFELQPAAIEYGTNFVARGNASFSNAIEIQEPPIEYGTPYNSLRFLQQKAFSAAGEVRAYALAVDPSQVAAPHFTLAQEITMLLDLIIYPAIRSAVLPNSTGKVSHLRILTLQRTEERARRMFDIMKDQI